MDRLSRNSVLFILPSQNFRDEEYTIPNRILSENHISTNVSSSRTAPVRGHRGSVVEPDILIQNVDLSSYSALIVVGGDGAKEYWTSSDALDLIRNAHRQNRIVAGICLGAVCLQKAGILEGKRATCWPEEYSSLHQNQSICRGAPVEVDQRIITATGYHAAERMTSSLLQLL